MIYTVPHYYKEFHCIAGACRDTCCAGWQIMIDGSSLQKYKKAGGGLGNRLHNSVLWKEGRFKQYDGRCAFLNEENLCDLYAEGGKDMLCRTCREYPRHTEEFEGCRESSLSLSCEEAARIILGCKEPVRFVTTERPGEETYEDFDFFLYTKLADSRDLMLRILQNRQLDFRLRFSMVLALAHDIQRRIDGDRLFAVDSLLERYGAEGAAERFSKKLEKYAVSGRERMRQMRQMFGAFGRLEVLKETWTAYICGLEQELYGDDRGEAAGAARYAWNRERFLENMDREQLEIWKEQLAVYFVFTYYCGAVYDGRAYEKIKLAAFGVLMITEMAQAIWQEKGRMELEDLVEAAHRFSKEVEHSDDNLRTLERLFRSGDVFGLENLLRVI